MTKKHSENAVLLVFCAPALLVYLVFKLYPAASGIFYGLTDWNGLSRNFTLIGFENFREILGDRYYWNSVLFTLKYVAVMVVAANLTALLLALAIESRNRGKGLFRTLFYLPNMISMIIGGYMWNFIFTKVLYYMADHWGISFLDKSWIGNPSYSFLAIILVASWGSVGYLMIIYMAALQGVPIYLKEAARLDGAGAFQSFVKVTLPMIRHGLTICIFWTLNSAFQVFDVIYSLTGGGPGRATQSVAINIYEEAFKGNIRYGYATAKSTVLFLIVLVFTMIQLNVMKKGEQEL